MKKNTFCFIVILLSHFLLPLRLAFLYSQEPAVRPLDELLTRFKKHSREDTVKANILIDIAFEYCRIDPVKGIDYGMQGLDLSKKLDSKVHISAACNAIGVCYYVQSDYTKALEYYFNALKINEKLGNKNNLARNLSNIGLVYYNQSDYPMALEYFFKALKTNEELKNEEGMANKLGNIGLVYVKQKKYDKALEYYNKALEINTKIKNQLGISINLGNIGNLYTEMKDYNKALDYHFRATEIDKALGNKRGLAADYGNVGDVFTLRGEYGKALDFQNKALVIRKEINNQRGMMFSYGGIAEVYYQQAVDTSSNEFYNTNSITPSKRTELLRQSVEYAKKAVIIGNEIGSHEETSDWYSLLSKSYQELGDWKMAFVYADSFNTLKDSIFSAENRLKFVNLDHKRTTELNEKEIEVLKVREKHKKIAIFAISGGFLSLLIIILLIYRNLIHKKRTNRILEKNNFIIISQKEQLEFSHNLIQSDITNAAEYVKSLLPEILVTGPVTTAYKFNPSSRLGGDSFGYHWIDDEHFALYILDVCGHGIGAALHSVSALNMIRSGKSLNVDPRKPSAVANSLNSTFQMENHGDLFFSLWYGVLKIPDGKEKDKSKISLSYVCAGHPSPILFSPGGEASELGPPSLTIGCLPEYSYQEQKLTLDPGSFLILFSDGTYEITKKDQSIMSLEEFYNMVSKKYNAQGIDIEQLYQDIKELNIHDPFEDDVSLISLKV